jgi:hypothetical protein
MKVNDFVRTAEDQTFQTHIGKQTYPSSEEFHFTTTDYFMMSDSIL